MVSTKKLIFIVATILFTTSLAKLMDKRNLKRKVNKHEIHGKNMISQQATFINGILAAYGVVNVIIQGVNNCIIPNTENPAANFEPLIDAYTKAKVEGRDLITNINENDKNMLTLWQKKCWDPLTNKEPPVDDSKEVLIKLFEYLKVLVAGIRHLPKLKEGEMVYGHTSKEYDIARNYLIEEYQLVVNAIEITREYSDTHREGSWKLNAKDVRRGYESIARAVAEVGDNFSQNTVDFEGSKLAKDGISSELNDNVINEAQNLLKKAEAVSHVKLDDHFLNSIANEYNNLLSHLVGDITQSNGVNLKNALLVSKVGSLFFDQLQSGYAPSDPEDRIKAEDSAKLITTIINGASTVNNICAAPISGFALLGTQMLNPIVNRQTKEAYSQFWGETMVSKIH